MARGYFLCSGIRAGEFEAISTPSLVCNRRPSRCFSSAFQTSFSSHVVFISVGMLDRCVPSSSSSSWKSCQPFSNTLHHFLTYCTLINSMTVRVYQLTVNFERKNHVSALKNYSDCKLPRGTSFTVWLSLHLKLCREEL